MRMDMDGAIQERDWKYLSSIKEELLNELCSRILTNVAKVAAEEKGSPHERDLTLFRYIDESDDIIAECFNDWRRSRIGSRILNMRRHRLLTDEHIRHMSEKAQQWLHMVEEL